MGLRGPKPQWREFKWSSELAYAVGLFATDGCLYGDSRHLSFVSMDKEQLRTFKRCLKLKTKITFKNNSHGGKCPHVQLSDVALYQFLLGLGLTPNKSKTLGPLKIPKQYFFDFFRGVLDGDGCFYSYYDPRWRSSFMFYLVVASASPKFVAWLQSEIQKRIQITGHVTRSRGTLQLRYAKKDSLKILKKVYHSPTVPCLSRKRKKILKALQSQGLNI